MSKAILIIDVDENADLENAIADITFRDNEWGVAPRGIKHWYNGIKVKPLPQKKKLDSDLFLTNNFGLQYARFKGYNECLDKILGGHDV